MHDQERLNTQPIKKKATIIADKLYRLNHATDDAANQLNVPYTQLSTYARH